MIVLLIVLSFVLFFGNILCFGLHDTDLRYPNLSHNIKPCFYTIPFFPGIYLARFLHENPPRNLVPNFVKSFHKFMCKNPLDLVKFRIRIEKK